MTKRRFKIADEMYDTTVHVFLNYSYEAMKAAMDADAKHAKKKLTWDEDDVEYYSDCEAAYLTPKITGESNKRIIWIKEIGRDNLGFITASHECMHASLEILQEREVGYSKDSEEAFVRHHDFLFKRILEKL